MIDPDDFTDWIGDTMVNLERTLAFDLFEPQDVESIIRRLNSVTDDIQDVVSELRNHLYILDKEA